MANSSLIDSVEDAAFLSAISRATSWSDLLRALGYSGSPKPRVYETARRRAESLGYDVVALNERGSGPLARWGKDDLIAAVATCATISDVATELGASVSTVRAAIERFEVDAAHLSGVVPRRMVAPILVPEVSLASLRIAAESLAAAWYTLHGAEVFVPVNGTSECDLVAMIDRTAVHVQVKSTTYVRQDRYFVGIGNSGRSRAWERRAFDASKADELFVVCGSAAMYRIPAAQADGKVNIHLTEGYEQYRVHLT